MSSDLNRRRSPRIAEERPIEVAGTNVQAIDFLAPSYTILLSRYGAKIHCKQAIVPDQEITIFHPETGEDCLARVVGLYDRLSSGYAYGIEFLDPDRDFWSFAFPPASEVAEVSIPVEPDAAKTAAAAAPPTVTEPPKAESSLLTVGGEAMQVMNTLQQRQQSLEVREMLERTLAATDNSTRRVEEQIRIKQRRESRRWKAVRVKVYGTDRSGNPFSQTTLSVDVSRSGACLEGVGFLTAPGMTIEVKRGWKKALFRVVWVGKRGNPRAGHVGILCLEPEKNIWTSALEPYSRWLYTRPPMS